MTQDEIRTLLKFRDAPEANCGQVNILLDAHIGHVAARITELKILERQLKALRRQCDAAQATRDCGILNELASEAASPTKPRKSETSHVYGVHARSKKEQR